MIAAALITSATLALSPAGGQNPSVKGGGNPPKINTFLVFTGLRAERFLRDRVKKGDLIFGTVADGVYFDPDSLVIENARNARVTWHVQTHRRTKMIDWTSRCRLSDKMTVPQTWQPTGISIRCTKWRDHWF